MICTLAGRTHRGEDRFGIGFGVIDINRTRRAMHVFWAQSDR
jgi:hypothetical protein